MNKRIIEDITEFPSKKRTVTKITTVTTIVTEEEELDDKGRVIKTIPLSTDEQQTLSSQIAVLLRQYGETSKQQESPERPISSMRPALPYHQNPVVPTKPTVDPYHPSNSAAPSTILEKGHVYFFYRPKVNVTEVRSLVDVQTLYILTKRMGKGQENFYRLLRVGKKKMPSIKEHNRFWAQIEEASADLDAIRSIIGTIEYTTITRGDRTLEPCRRIGEGFYAIINQGNTAHLAYVLEYPTEITQLQKEFNIEKEGVFYLAAKNPQDSTVNIPGIPGVTTTPTNVELPHELQATFNGKSWASPLPISMMSYKGLELILIGESNNVVAQFGKTGEMIEKEEELEVKRLAIYNDLRSDNEQPIEPL